MVLPGRVDVSRAVITLERGDMSPSLNMTCLRDTRGRRRDENGVRQQNEWEDHIRERGMQIQARIRLRAIAFQLPL